MGLGRSIGDLGRGLCGGFRGGFRGGLRLGLGGSFSLGFGLLGLGFGGRLGLGLLGLALGFDLGLGLGGCLDSGLLGGLGGLVGLPLGRGGLLQLGLGLGCGFGGGFLVGPLLGPAAGILLGLGRGFGLGLQVTHGDLVGELGVRGHDGHLAADDPLFAAGHGEAGLHELDGGLATVLDVTLDELLGAVAATGELAGQGYLTAPGAGLHDPLEHGVASPAEVPAALEGEDQLGGHDLGIEMDVLDLHGLDLGILQVEEAFDLVGEPLDVATLAADDDAGTLGLDGDAGAQGGPQDVEPAEARPVHGLGHVLVDQDPAETLLDELVDLGFGAGHRSSSSSSRTMTSRFTVSWLEAEVRPRARDM